MTCYLLVADAAAAQQRYVGQKGQVLDAPGVFSIIMTFEVTFDHLHAPDNGQRHLPLSKVDTRRRSHIHGALRVIVNNRELPYLGYFGDSDVCIGTWLAELIAARKALLRSDPGEYLFDEGEQGQPAFLFHRQGARVLVSVVASEISGTQGDPDWQRVSCTIEEFLCGLDDFLHRLRDLLERELQPAVFPEWWKRHVEAESPSP